MSFRCTLYRHCHLFSSNLSTVDRLHISVWEIQCDKFGLLYSNSGWQIACDGPTVCILNMRLESHTLEIVLLFCVSVCVFTVNIRFASQQRSDLFDYKANPIWFVWRRFSWKNISDTRTHTSVGQMPILSDTFRDNSLSITLRPNQICKRFTSIYVFPAYRNWFSIRLKCDWIWELETCT